MSDPGDGGRASRPPDPDRPQHAPPSPTAPSNYPMAPAGCDPQWSCEQATTTPGHLTKSACNVHPLVSMANVGCHTNIIIIIIMKLYCRIQRALHDELECSLAGVDSYSAYIYNKMKYDK